METSEGPVLLVANAHFTGMHFMSGILPPLPHRFSLGHIWNWAPMSGSQNSGLGYESNLLSALFVFTENPMNPSRKHLLKCKRQGGLIHTLNLAHRNRFFFCSPKGMLTRFCGESDKSNRYKRVSSSRGVCMYVCNSYVCLYVCNSYVCRGGEDSSPNTELERQNWCKKQDSTTKPITIHTRDSTFLIWLSYLFMWYLTLKLLQIAFQKQKISLKMGITYNYYFNLKQAFRKHL